MVKSRKQRQKQSRSKRNRHKKTPNTQSCDNILILEYFQIAFSKFHQQLELEGFSIDVPHPKRESFWRMVIPGMYSPSEARDLLQRYLWSVDEQLREELGKHSVFYWLHIYR
ncbi:MAG: hypothetical protein ACYTF1_06220, partial [Planctomycetota bacterium]